jgi:hypothetical protein
LCGFAHRLPPLAIERHGREAIGDRVDVADIDDRSRFAIANEVGQHADIGREHRQAGGHRLQHRERTGFLARHQGEHIHRRQHMGNVLARSGEDDALFHAQPFRRAPDFGAVARVFAADQQQPRLRRLANDFAKRLRKIELVLAVVDEAHRADHERVVIEAEFLARSIALACCCRRKRHRFDEVGLHSQRRSCDQVAPAMMLCRAG